MHYNRACALASTNDPRHSTQTPNARIQKLRPCTYIKDRNTYEHILYLYMYVYVCWMHEIIYVIFRCSYALFRCFVDSRIQSGMLIIEIHMDVWRRARTHHARRQQRRWWWQLFAAAWNNLPIICVFVLSCVLDFTFFFLYIYTTHRQFIIVYNIDRGIRIRMIFTTFKKRKHLKNKKKRAYCTSSIYPLILQIQIKFNVYISQKEIKDLAMVLYRKQLIFWAFKMHHPLFYCIQSDEQTHRIYEHIREGKTKPLRLVLVRIKVKGRMRILKLIASDNTTYGRSAASMNRLCTREKLCIFNKGKLFVCAHARWHIN